MALSFLNLWTGIVTFLPNILIAVIVFVVGWVVGVVVGGWIEKLFKTAKIDQGLAQLGINDLSARAGYRLNSGAFVGGLVKWFIILAFLTASLEVLELNQVNAFLGQVLSYLPNVIVAVLILIVAALVADALRNIIVGSARAAGIASAELFGGIVKWIVWIFAILAALTQLGIAVGLLQTLFTGLVAMLAIAGGLAFGLGGQEAARDFIAKLRQDVGGK